MRSGLERQTAFGSASDSSAKRSNSTGESAPQQDGPAQFPISIETNYEKESTVAVVSLRQCDELLNGHPIHWPRLH